MRSSQFETIQESSESIFLLKLNSYLHFGALNRFVRGHRANLMLNKLTRGYNVNLVVPIFSACHILYFRGICSESVKTVSSNFWHFSTVESTIILSFYIQNKTENSIFILLCAKTWDLVQNSREKY